MKPRSWLWMIILAACIMGLPPLLWLSGTVVYAVVTYDGICPGMMDIPPYTCSVWEYIGRNTVSPFALIVHAVIIGGWLVLSGGAIVIGVGVRLLVVRTKVKR